MSVPPTSIEHMSEIDALSVSGDQLDPDPDPDPEAVMVPLGRLEERICELAGHLAAGTCRFLRLVAEFDVRRGWACWDLPSCAAWLAWKCQVAPGTAREQVRVARALGGLPVICAEFAAGRMSYAKVRALTRIATSATEAGLAEITGPMTAAQCERFVAAHRTASDAQDVANRTARRVSVTVGEDGSVAISAQLPAAEGAVVLQALRAAAGDCEHPHRPHHDTAEDTAPAENTVAAADSPRAEDGGGVSAGTGAGAGAGPGGGEVDGPGGGICRASLADALVEVAGAYLSGKIVTAGNPDLYQVIVHVGPEALIDGPDPVPGPTAAASPSGVSAETPDGTPFGPGAGPQCRVAGHPAQPRRCHLEDGPAISPAAARALACRATVSWMLHDHDGNLLDSGRRHRRPTAALRRAVRERDKGRCQFPGCRSRRTDIHHVIPWAKGGKTRLRDLILLCEAHHVIVHARGWLITPAATGGFGFTRPDGQRMPHGPVLPGSDGDLAGCHDADITTETIIPAGLADKLDLDLAIWACFANARLDQQRAGQQHEQDLAA
jgi:5-methylcytosine-specific restriction endonuclease McrA